MLLSILTLIRTFWINVKSRWREMPTKTKGVIFIAIGLAIFLLVVWQSFNDYRDRKDAEVNGASFGTQTAINTAKETTNTATKESINAAIETNQATANRQAVQANRAANSSKADLDYWRCKTYNAGCSPVSVANGVLNK